MKKLLWIGDAGVPSGFALATHKILETLHRAFDVTVLGLNYRGDPHAYPYPIYAAGPGGDSFGLGRLNWLCHTIKPDVIIVQQDGWNIPFYIRQLRLKRENGEYHFPEQAAIPVIAAVAVDGKNFQGKWLEGISQAIFWTDFALKEASEGGYIGSAEVVPLGVDLETYSPMDCNEARSRRGLPNKFDDAFIVGNVNRNQPRKRWDLMIGYFAKWVIDYDVQDAYLFLHCAPTGDAGVDVNQLVEYYGIKDRLILVQPPPFYGVSEQTMRETYCCFDVNASTTQGEGFGLTTLEAMACGVPCIVPEWSGLGSWADGAAAMIPCESTAIGSPYVNVIGGVPEREQFISMLDTTYRSEKFRAELRRAGLERSQEARFRWENISGRYAEVLAGVLKEPVDEAVWQEATV